MHAFLPFIVVGLATGAVYGLAGLGLVLTYKTSGIFNFGYGSVAALIAFMFYFLHTEHRIPWPVAAAIAVLVFAPAVGLVLELLARSLDGVGETVKVVATVGLILIVEALASFWHPANPPSFPHFLPQSTIRVLGVNITWEQIIIFVFSAAASAVLYWFFRTVRLGIAMRAIVDSHELVSMSGDNPVLVRRWAWVIGTAFAGMAGLMLGPDQPLDGISLTTLVFASFGAAAIGYFANLPLTFIGGLLIGVAGAIMDKYAGTISWVGGIPPSLPFIILFVVLIVTPRSRLVRHRLAAQARVRRPYHAPWRMRVLAGVVAIGLLALVPSLQSNYLALWSQALTNVILFLSLGLLVRHSGQISLCQLAFAAVGAAAFGHFASSFGLPWLLSLLLAMLVAVPVGAVVAIPAIRVSGVYLALATLGFGILAQDVFYTRSFMFGSSTLGIADPRPNISIGGLNLSSDKGFYFLLLFITVLVVLVVTVITVRRPGRLMEAMADSPIGLETHGASSTVLKVIVFCITAAIASLAGALTGMLFHYGVGAYFDPFTSLTLVVLTVIVTVGSPWYAVLGAVGNVVIAGYLHGPNVSNGLTLLFGVSACTAAFATRIGGTPLAVQRILDRLGGRRPEPAPALATIAVPATPGRPQRVLAGQVAGAAYNGWADARPSDEPAGLEVRELSVSFGGTRAVNGVSLCVPKGMITGLIGPNGAGKTTIFNACSGLVRPQSGHILLHGTEIGRQSPAVRARRGLGRTFQRPEVFTTLSVRQNVAMGYEAAVAGRNPLSQLFDSRSANRAISAATQDALALTGTNRIADVQVGLLSIGQRRLVELATVLTGPFDLLLLDEPSSGLDARETEAFGRVLQTVLADRGLGIFLVEHDMTLVRGVCGQVYVLDFGSLIFQGTCDEMQQSPQVRAAYLGETVTVASDGPGNAPSDSAVAPAEER